MSLAPFLHPSALYQQLMALGDFSNLALQNHWLTSDALHSIADVERMLDAIHFWLLPLDHMPQSLIQYALEHKEEIREWVSSVCGFLWSESETGGRQKNLGSASR